MSTTTNTPDAARSVRANLRGDTPQDLETILAANQAARLDAQLVAEWEARS